MEETLLIATGIHKSYSGVKVLENVDLHIRKGEVHALLGENGAGKSTLMKILTGVVKYDAGEIKYKGKRLEIQHPKEAQNLGIGIVYQEFNLLPDLTVAQNIFIGREPESKIKGFINDQELNKEAKQVLTRLNSNINPTTKVGDLSVAEQQIVEIAKSLSYNCNLLILDEPTAALTEKEIEALFQVIYSLREQGVAFIYISHRMNELKQIADRVTILRDGQFISEHLFKDISIDSIIKKMVGRELVNVFPDKPKYQKGAKTLEVKNLNVENKLKNISFQSFEGEILGIAGLMGAGRTELARVIFGADKATSGDIYLYGKKVKINSPTAAIKHGLSYITEDRKKDGVFLELSIKNNILVSSYDKYAGFAGLISEKKSNEDTDHYIKKLGVKSVNKDQLVVDLSGGNQQKVILAKWFCSQAKVFIFDEPTRGIDVGAKYEIYELMFELVKNNVTVIMISSELPEILGISDRILVMSEGEITADLLAEEADQQKITHYAIGSKG